MGTVVSCSYRGSDRGDVSTSSGSRLPQDITQDTVVYMDNSVHHVGRLHV